MTAQDEIDVATLTSDNTYFEDFAEGDVYRHARGKTLSEGEMHSITHLTMNTAEAHFNADKMDETEFGGRINYGGLTMSIVLGLASTDTTENIVRTIGLDEIRFQTPVQIGDTLYAVTEVIETDKTATSKADTGLVRFKHYGLKQNDEHVFTGIQECIVKQRAYDGRDS